MVSKMQQMNNNNFCIYVNSIDDLDIEDLGFAEQVYEHEMGDDKYTFVEGVKNPLSCTILIKGPNEHVKIF